MKTILILIGLLVYSQYSVGQTNTMKVSQSSSNQANEISPEKKKEAQKRISQIDAHLNSIEIKRNYILEHPEEKDLAEQQGWFDDMDRIKNELIAEKERLQKLLK